MQRSWMTFSTEHTSKMQSDRVEEVSNPRLRPRHRRLRVPRRPGSTTTTNACAHSRRNRNLGNRNSNEQKRQTDKNNRRCCNKNRARYNSWVNNKGWWGTTADNRMPPRGAVGEPRRTPSTNTNWFSNRAEEESAVSKSSERPRDPEGTITNTTSMKNCNKRGFRSKESRLRRIENRNQEG